jgi:hypothetical protein
VKRLKRLLEATPVDREAEDRVWQVVRAAYAEREPVRRRGRPRYVVAFAALVVAVAAAALSPPGRAVVDAVRRSIGVEHAAPALFRLPAPGRLLVSGPGGAWIVSADGSKRRLGDYTQASWSPHSLYVIAAAANELAAVEPSGTVHWQLARPQVTFPRWGGSRTDTRVAYLTAGRLHVVGGDGKGDAQAVGPRAAKLVAPSWRPGDRRMLAYVTTGGRVAVLDVDRRAVAWIARNRGEPTALAWSPDGKTLVVATRTLLVLMNAETGHPRVVHASGIRAVAWAPDGRLAVVRGHSVLLLVAVPGDPRLTTLFSAPGRLRGLAWSPNGRWLLTSLPSADQWIFLSGRRVAAVSNIRGQLGGPVTLDGWAPGA